DNGRGRSERSERSSSEGSLSVTVPAGVVFDDFCAWAASEGLWGPENLSLIPGEVGASAVQNIGAYGVEAKDIIADIRAWDRTEGRFVHIDPADCAYGYRTSKFKTEWKGRYIITAVTYRLSREPKPILDYGGIRKALEMRSFVTTVPQDDSCHSERSEESLTPQIIRDTIIGIRNQKLPDPAVTGSAGSFFCNPVISQEHFARIVAIAQKDNGPEYLVPHYVVGDQIKVPAAWMIEQCGFKGAVNGGAQVYPKQPLVIVNASGEASPEEIIGLEQRIIGTIQKKYGITLHPEVEHV
ncbi:MAG: UDP-N-acetylmuramate dehydrogenase, partial [Bacteroidales bacterium]|nr:UDP-N-acetylmuramate dehydrogenase [Bacteroidales bacterium]